MNKYVVGGFLAFAFGVAAITQTSIELGIKPAAKQVNEALSGANDKQAPTEVTSIKPAAKSASNPYGLVEYEPAPVRK